MDEHIEPKDRREADPPVTDQVEFAGQAILGLLHKAADASDARSRQTVDAARGLSETPSRSATGS